MREFVVPLVKAVQEPKQIIEQHNNDIETQRNDIERLQTSIAQLATAVNTSIQEKLKHVPKKINSIQSCST